MSQADAILTSELWRLRAHLEAQARTLTAIQILVEALDAAPIGSIPNQQAKILEDLADICKTNGAIGEIAELALRRARDVMPQGDEMLTLRRRRLASAARS